VRRRSLTCGEADHDVVGAQGIAEQTFGAQRSGAAFQIPQHRRTDALALPAVVDRQPELEPCRIGFESIAGLTDDGLNAVDRHDRDHAETIILSGMDEMTEFGLRKLPHRAEETIVAERVESDRK